MRYKEPQSCLVHLPHKWGSTLTRFTQIDDGRVEGAITAACPPGLAWAGLAAHGAISEIRISGYAEIFCGMFPFQGQNKGVFSFEGMLWGE